MGIGWIWFCASIAYIVYLLIQVYIARKDLRNCKGECERLKGRLRRIYHNLHEANVFLDQIQEDAS